MSYKFIMTDRDKKVKRHGVGVGVDMKLSKKRTVFLTSKYDRKEATHRYRKLTSGYQ